MVGVSLDRASALALRRAYDLSRGLGLEPLLVHVLPSDSPGGRSRERGEIVDLAARRASLQRAKRAVQEWSLFETGIALPATSVRVCVGDVAEELCRAARRAQAEVMVIGGRADSSGADPGALTHAVLARAACPVLVCGPERWDGALVAATDLVHRGAPVVRVAARFAEALRRPLTVVHNENGVTLRGVTYPLPERARQQVVVERLESLTQLVDEIEQVHDATLTRESVTVDAILRVARARDVDVIVVGGHPAVGLTCTSVVTEARRSVLVVPLP